MLIDFTVENYRSIKGPVTLSAVAQGRKAGTAPKGKGRPRIKPDHEIAPGYSVEGWGFELLPVLAIFGANASGKSNVIKALDDFLAFISWGSLGFFRRHHIHSSRVINFDQFVPFKLDSASSTAPTRFEIRLALQGDIYTYSLSLNQEHVLSEHLDYAKASSKRNRRLFHRDWDEGKGSFVWRNGDDFRGPHTQLEESLNKEETFIGLWHRFNIQVIDSLKAWISQQQICAQTLYGLESKNVAFILTENRDEKILELLQQFDIGISSFKRGDWTSGTHPRLFACHDTEQGSVCWPFEEESDGTKRLLGLAQRINDVFSSGSLMIIDELEKNLHPHITQAIVRMFQNPKTNPKHAQLIFTSHDNTLQRGNLLRRDQVWFTQKRSDGSTELYPLSDFKVRNDLAIDRAYLDGRFGAVPFLPDEEFISISEG